MVGYILNSSSQWIRPSMRKVPKIAAEAKKWILVATHQPTYHSQLRRDGCSLLANPSAKSRRYRNKPSAIWTLYRQAIRCRFERFPSSVNGTHASRFNGDPAWYYPILSPALISARCLNIFAWQYSRFVPFFSLSSATRLIFPRFWCDFLFVFFVNACFTMSILLRTEQRWNQFSYKTTWKRFWRR